MKKIFEARNKASVTTGRTFCFRLKRMVVKPDSSKIMLNQYIHQLSRKTVGDKEDIYITLLDLAKILSPDMIMKDSYTLDFHGINIKFTPDYRTVEIGEEMVMLRKTPFETTNGLYVPIGEIMEKIFGQYTCRIGSYIAICDSEDGLNEPFDGPWTQALSENRLNYRFKKTYGDMYYTMWMPEVNQLNVYRMYIPSGYKKEKPWKLLVCLHGGNGNSDSVFIRSNKKLQYYAEEYQYLILAPNSYVHGSNYGGKIPPVHMFKEPEVKTEYPEYYSEEELEENKIAQNYFVNVLHEVLERWNIDREHIFVTGNSMGSVGTFHALSEWPELFRAGVPTAVMPLTEYLNIETIKEKPMYFMVGTEDSNDPSDMWKRYEDLKSKGCNIKFHMIGGGYHSDAWVSELKRIFQFFEEF